MIISGECRCLSISLLLYLGKLEYSLVNSIKLVMFCMESVGVLSNLHTAVFWGFICVKQGKQIHHLTKVPK